MNRADLDIKEKVFSSRGTAGWISWQTSRFFEHNPRCNHLYCCRHCCCCDCNHPGRIEEEEPKREVRGTRGVEWSLWDFLPRCGVQRCQRQQPKIQRRWWHRRCCNHWWKCILSALKKNKIEIASPVFVFLSRYQSDKVSEGSQKSLFVFKF